MNTIIKIAAGKQIIMIFILTISDFNLPKHKNHNVKKTVHKMSFRLIC